MFAALALKPQHNLFCSFSLLVENRLSLPTSRNPKNSVASFFDRSNGECSKDKEDILQVEGMPKAHLA